MVGRAIHYFNQEKFFKEVDRVIISPAPGPTPTPAAAPAFTLATAPASTLATAPAPPTRFSAQVEFWPTIVCTSQQCLILRLTSKYCLLTYLNVFFLHFPYHSPFPCS